MGECVCNEKKFCKRCYSRAYYAINRDRILQYQKEKYRKNKTLKAKIIFKYGEFILKF